ncbi:hypothetical protein QYE76_042434 [Lolium multiflorum]|uniref:Uncharacterized protein n=1 Tax=Lolium multiflorum TaxID=4521 RepID=A0AAD8WWY9_LOLMU|nr:hypothetical protein QYE76_042434 [Lolium multiflorum]
MYGNRLSGEFTTGLKDFLVVANANKQGGFVICPCVDGFSFRPACSRERQGGTLTSARDLPSSASSLPRRRRASRAKLGAAAGPPLPLVWRWRRGPAQSAGAAPLRRRRRRPDGARSAWFRRGGGAAGSLLARPNAGASVAMGGDGGPGSGPVGLDLGRAWTGSGWVGLRGLVPGQPGVAQCPRRQRLVRVEAVAGVWPGWQCSCLL